jgi:hypothetical protein
LEPGYNRRGSHFFGLGRVFITLWHETGTAGNPHLRTMGKPGTPGDGVEGVFSHFRRFAVVRNCHGFCWAIQVNTYGDQGVLRPSFNELDVKAHAIIYMRGTTPTELPDEPRMTKRPIMVIPSSDDRKLKPSSRIRFDKVFSIEHNVQVKNVGFISGESKPYFEQYWRAEAQSALDAMSTRSSSTGHY